MRMRSGRATHRRRVPSSCGGPSRDGAAYAALLAAAGGALSLAEAAEALAISRQAMHALIRTGRALGLKAAAPVRTS